MESFKTIFAKTNSIFALYENEGDGVTIQTLNETYIDTTLVMTDLTSLSLFGENNRSRARARIFKGG